jgi:hypothetical protein
VTDALATSPQRSCGDCSLCCTALRVDEIGKLAGVPCEHQLPRGGCAIHARRPKICRAYQCLWLDGGLREDDRPDRLGAVVDIVREGIGARLSIQEGSAGAFDGSRRLREIADEHRESMPVRVVPAGNVLDPDRPYRVLVADGGEHRVEGEWVEHYREGRRISRERLSFIERQARRLAILIRRFKLARAARRR